MISAANATDLLNQANTQGTQGWELSSVALAMEALGYVIEDLGPQKFNQQLWWAVGTLANMGPTSQS
jgi:hypothetical protein